MSIELTLLSRVRCRGRDVAGAQVGGLLAALAGDLRAGRGTGWLVAELWPEERPEHPVKALQLLVSRARSRLGADLIVSTPTGYRLGLTEEQVDATAVVRHAQRAAEGDLASAEAGLALCEGASEWDTAGGDPLSVLRAARLGTYRSLLRSRALALSRRGRRREAVAPLTELAAEQPMDEEILAELLRCEAATAGTAAALARYDAYRRKVLAEVGSEPGPALRDVHRELLLSDVPAVRHGIRHEPNPLLGRDDDVAAVTELLRTSRVTSIIGPGGLGKTRVAHAVSRRAPQRTVHLVELAGVSPDGDVTVEVASALGAPRAPVGRVSQGTVHTAILDALTPGPALLVLDNCEHVVRSTAELVHALVSLSEDLRVLTTSRAPLGLSSESVYRLPELDAPTTVALFEQRARAARPGVELPDRTVKELCARLDGLPLAVELAAARVRVMSVEEIADRLGDRFALLRGNSRDAPGRHRTLHAVIDWSWHLLEPAGQAALRALSVFPGGFTASAARHLLGDDAVLEQLVDQSLLDIADAGPARFRMLEAVREFGTARREEAGETDRVVAGFLRWATDFGVEYYESLLDENIVAGMRVVRAEQDNLVQALRYGLDRSDGAAVAVATAVLGCLWLTESDFDRMITLAVDTAWVLSHFRPGPELVEVTRAAAVLCALSGFLTRGNRPLRTLLTVRRLPPGDPDNLVGALQAPLSAPDVPALLALCDSDRPLVAGMANYVASYFWENADQPDRALNAARKMLACVEKAASPLVRAVAHGRMSELCLTHDPGEPAYRHLRAGLEILTDLGWQSTVDRGRWVLVVANLQRGAVDEAEQWLDQAVRTSGEAPNGMAMFETCARAQILIGRGQVEAGLDLWRQAAERVRADQAVAESWSRHVWAVAVITHADHGRLDLVTSLTDALPAELARPHTDARIFGSLLFAQARVDLDAGAIACGVRMIALALRFGLMREFHPTMSPERAEAVAERADAAVYAAAVSEYTALDRDGLRAAAAQLLGSRRNSVTDAR